MDENILVLYPCPKSLTNDLETDEILISFDLNNKLKRYHRLGNEKFIVPRCVDTFPKATCLLDCTFEQAILLYRQLFYSTWEVSAINFNINKLIETHDHINHWTFNSPPVIIDYGGAFQTGHLHLIQYLFPRADIYSIDGLYKELDLLVFKINDNNTKWCIIPIYSSTNEDNVLELIECLSQELKGKSSVSNNIQMEFFIRIPHIDVYDPYSEILSLKKIHFVDSLRKCPNIPWCVFMAYETHELTPEINQLYSRGLTRCVHTKIDMSDVESKHRLRNGFLLEGKEITSITQKLFGETQWSTLYAKFIDEYQVPHWLPNVNPLPRKNQIKWLHSNDITKFLCGRRFRVPNSDYNNPMANLFRITNTKLLWNVDCLNLTPLLIANNIESVTSSIIQQFLEQHVDDYWKDDNNILKRYPKHFVQECLHELLGTVNNIRIYIESEQDILYASKFAEQLKKEDSNLYLEYSLSEYIKQTITSLYESAVILVFEINQNWIVF